MAAKRYVRLAFLSCVFSAFALLAQDNPQPRTVVLPNPNLIGCVGKACAPPLDFSGDPDTMVFPTQIALDIGEKGCQYGFIAYYDKSVSAEALRAALNARYPNSVDYVGEIPRRFWRLDPEKAFIQLATVDKKDHQLRPDVEVGTKQLIYLRISSTCKPRK